MIQDLVPVHEVFLARYIFCARVLRGKRKEKDRDASREDDAYVD